MRAEKPSRDSSANDARLLAHLRKLRHTTRLRNSYKAAADKAREIASGWDTLSDEVWLRPAKEIE